MVPSPFARERRQEAVATRGPARGLLAFSILAAMSCAGPATPDRPELMVYAAASLREALGEAARECDARAGARAVLNFGGSNDLARQILAARRADIFISADEARMDLVEKAGLVAAGTRVALLSNRLVVVAPPGSGLDVRKAEDLAGPGVTRLSLADPDSVPAGRYAKEWLVKAGSWERIRDRVLPGVDVRAALAAVESGGAQAGVVYATDAAVSKDVKVVYEVPVSEGPKISYAAAAIAGRPALDRSRAFLDCLAAGGGREIFRRHGFLVPGP